MRSERALKLAVAEMYFQGISTRKVKKVMEELCGFEVTSSEVNNAAKLLDEELKSWRDRSLGCYRYVYLDAQYKKIRYAGSFMDCAILIAVGIDESGRRDILGLSVSLSEHDEKTMPRLSTWMEENIPESLTHLQFPEEHQRRIRTSNMLERLNKEIRRRTRIIGVFPNTESCERLTSAILMEIADEWQSGVRYLTF